MLVFDVGDPVVEFVELFVKIVQKTSRDKLSIGVVSQFFSKVFLHLGKNHPHFDSDALFYLLDFLLQLTTKIFPYRTVLFTLQGYLLSQLIHCLVLLLQLLLERLVKLVVALLNPPDLNSHYIQLVLILQTFF